MSYVAARAAIERIRELVQGEAGDAVRSIGQTRFGGALHSGLDIREQRRLGVLDTKPVEVSLRSLRRHPQSLTIAGDCRLYEMRVEVRVVRTVAIDGQVCADTRDEIAALAIEDADALTQVLEWPNNLTTTSLGVATGLKGMLLDGTSATLTGEAGAAMDLTTTHTYDATLLSRPATA